MALLDFRFLHELIQKRNRKSKLTLLANNTFGLLKELLGIIGNLLRSFYGLFGVVRNSLLYFYEFP
jgi:hypothetical protein